MATVMDILREPLGLRVQTDGDDNLEKIIIKNCKILQHIQSGKCLELEIELLDSELVYITNVLEVDVCRHLEEQSKNLLIQVGTEEMLNAFPEGYLCEVHITPVGKGKKDCTVAITTKQE